ncbi:MAG: cation diffusion facilitator family transporter [Bacteroidota bacterium]|mgnify:FL=1|jgi:cation diffusion facilitator family transporter|nr:cation diffusion facilitator family transporter [Bacteroidota bacterium]HHU97560.1 cation transporter [Petrimonas sp.]
MKTRPLQTFVYLSIGVAVVTILLKFQAYRVTGSMGLLSDALESLVNLFAAIFALIMLNLSRKPADKKHGFGHGKAEYFSSATEGALILIAAFSIIWTAAPRLIDPQPIENVNVGLIYSLAAAGVNLLVGAILVKNGKKRNSLLLEADGRHLLTDVFTTLGVVVGVVIVSYTGWYILDPIIAIAVAIYILYSGYKLISRSANKLMDAAIPEEEVARIVAYLDSLKQEQVEYHSLLTRMAGQRRFISIHLLVPGEWSVQKGHEYADRIEETIVKMFDEPVTVQTHLEPVEDPASMRDIGLDRQ